MGLNHRQLVVFSQIWCRSWSLGEQWKGGIEAGRQQHLHADNNSHRQQDIIREDSATKAVPVSV